LLGAGLCKREGASDGLGLVDDGLFLEAVCGGKGGCVPFIARRPPLRQDRRMRPWNGPKRLKPKRKIKRKIQFK